MAKKQGKVKLIPVTKEQVAEGMQVYYPNHKQWYYVLEVREDGIIVVSSQKRKGEAIQYLFPIVSLKTLVVEYHADIDDENNWLKEIPLKYSQWQSAIDNGEVDSDKIVEFEITNTYRNPENMGNHKNLARIIPQKKRMYSERELEIAYCIGLLNRMLTIDELSLELKSAQKKIDLLKQAINRGDFEIK